MRRIVRAHLVIGILALAVCLVVSASAVPAAVVVDAAFNNVAQIRSGTNNPYFGTYTTQNVAAINLTWGTTGAIGPYSGGAVAGGTLNGIGFHDIDVSLAANQVPVTGVAVSNSAGGATSAGITMDYRFVDTSDLAPRNLTGTTLAPGSGSDWQTAMNVARTNYYISAPSVGNHYPNIVTFHGLLPNAPVYVQMVGGQHGWNGNVYVYVNGDGTTPSTGTRITGNATDWASNKTNLTPGLLGFTATTKNNGDLTIEMEATNTGVSPYAGIAALTVAERLPTLKLRLDASQLFYSEGASVATWQNTEGTGTFTAGGTQQPTFSGNAAGTGNKGVVFASDTSGTYGSSMSAGDLSSLLAGSTSATLYAVATINDNEYNVFTDTRHNDWWRFSGDSHSYLANFRTARHDAGGVAAGFPTTGTHLFSIDGATLQNTVFLDGLNVGNWSDGAFTVGTFWELSSVSTGPGPRTYLNGAIHEILVFDSSLTADQRAGLDWYMNQKWDLGLSLTATEDQIHMAERLLGIPEPSVLLLLATGLATLGASRLLRTRRRLG